MHGGKAPQTVNSAPKWGYPQGGDWMGPEVSLDVMVKKEIPALASHFIIINYNYMHV